MLDRSAAETHGYRLPRKVSDHVRHQDEPLRVACAQLATTPYTSHLQVPGLWSADANLMRCRDLNAATSQEVFAGPYLGDAAQRDKFSACFQDMTQGFLAFPLCFPGTAVWRARQGRLWILAVLRKGAAASKAAIKVRVRGRGRERVRGGGLTRGTERYEEARRERRRGGEGETEECIGLYICV